MSYLTWLEKLSIWVYKIRSWWIKNPLEAVGVIAFYAILVVIFYFLVDLAGRAMEADYIAGCMEFGICD